MAQGRSTKIKWIWTSRLSIKNSLSLSAAGRTARGGHGGAVGVAHGVEGPAQREVLRRLAVPREHLPPNHVGCRLPIEERTTWKEEREGTWMGQMRSLGAGEPRGAKCHHFS